MLDLVARYASHAEGGRVLFPLAFDDKRDSHRAYQNSVFEEMGEAMLRSRYYFFLTTMPWFATASKSDDLKILRHAHLYHSFSNSYLLHRGFLF